MQSFQVKIYLFATLLLTGTSQVVWGQAAETWDKAAATKEIDGMRRYAWVFSDAIGKTLEASSPEDFPAVHAFMRDFRTARMGIDSEQPPSKWRVIDTDKLVIRNPRYWSAVYEVAPADPLMMWFHSTLHAVNGQVHGVFYAQQLAVRSPVENRWKPEFVRLIVSSANLITFGKKGVDAGTKLHDQQKYAEAEKVYRDVLATIPSHSSALYELGYTIRSRNRGKNARDEKVAQSYFDQARKNDPFMMSAYQGTFRGKEIQQLQALRGEVLPAWTKLRATRYADTDIKQLQELSRDLQAAGLHELALIARQLVVAHREESYNKEDREFIGRSLKALIPDGRFAATLKGLSGDKAKLEIKSPTLPK